MTRHACCIGLVHTHGPWRGGPDTCQVVWGKASVISVTDLLLLDFVRVSALLFEDSNLENCDLRPELLLVFNNCLLLELF